MKRAGTALVVAGFAVVGLVGCDSGESRSKGATTTAKPALWNPCTEISDAALTEAGVDPATEETGLGGHAQPGWEICGWTGRDYSLTVYSTDRTVADFEQKPGNIDFTDVTIADRQGRQFKEQGDTRNLDCDVVFPAAGGVVQLQVLNSPIAKGLDDPCDYLQRAGAVLVPIFPK